MLYANEARKKTIEVREKCTSKDLAIIEEAINETIEAGQFMVEIRGALKPTVKEELEKMGYKVKYENQYNETHCYISWRDL